MTTEKKRRIIIDVIFIVMILAGAYLAVKYLTGLVLPFIIGFVVAVCLQRPVAFLTEKTKLSRAFWSVLLVLLVLCLLFGVVILAMWAIYDNASGFATWMIKDLAPEMKNTFSELSLWFTGIAAKMPKEMADYLQSAPSVIIDEVVGVVGGVVTGMLGSIVVSGPGLLISSVFSVVASCYITKDYRKITNFLLSQLSERKRHLVVKAKQLFVTNILKMLRGYIIIMFITYLEIFLGLSVLKVNYAGVLAAFIAVLDILPVLGTGTVLLPWAVISMLMGDLWRGVGLLIVYVSITVIRNIIEPRIIGQQVGLPPIVTLLAMYVGLKAMGILGMMLFPVTIIIIVKLQESGVIHIWNIPEKDDNEERKGIFSSAKKVFAGAFRKKESKTEE
ncbi:MAG: sporulation integral membrane protein YtvI [Ruminococcus sp.]|nr:sporulation integral membrane protein YtvI [Ruminococcus sp.]